jgi:hypothetical protein
LLVFAERPNPESLRLTDAMPLTDVIPANGLPGSRAFGFMKIL